MSTAIHKPLTALCLLLRAIPLLLSPGAGLDDGQWHSVSLSAKRSHLSVTVDGHVTPASPWLGPEQVNPGSIFYFGGKKRSQIMWSTGSHLCSHSCVLGIVSSML